MTKLPSAVCVFFLAFVPLSVKANDNMRVHFIDVGQGDATLIEFPCGTMLIDTGGERIPDKEWEKATYDSTQKLLAYLENVLGDDKRIDLLLLTHPHKDHTRGVPEVLRKYKPRLIVHNGQWHGSGAQDQADVLRYSKESEDVDSWYVLERTINRKGLSNEIIDPFDCGTVDPKIRILWGQVKDYKGWSYGDFQDENNHSVVVRIDYDKASILFTGDLEESEKENNKGGIERLIDKYKGTDMLDVDVYQVGHHGSHNGTTKELVKAMSPELAVISAGPACKRGDHSAWEYAHPRTETIEELTGGVSRDRDSVKNAKVFRKWNTDPITVDIKKAIYSTGWDGTVVLEASKNGDWKVTLGKPDSCLDGGG